MKRFIVYAPVTGEILRAGCCNDYDYPYQAEPGESIMEGSADDMLQYVAGGALVDRPDMPVSIDATTVPEDGTVTITGIPPGTVADVYGYTPTIDDGELKVSFGTLGSYKIRLHHFPHKDWEVDIAVTG